jgi:hypothetical protein
MTQDQSSVATYIELIDMLVALQPKTFAIKASPTLANQETVSFLFQKISEKKIKKNQNILRRIALLIEFFLRILTTFFLYLFFTIIFPNKKLGEQNVIRTWLVPKSINSRCIVDDYFRDEFLDTIQSVFLEKPAEIYMPLGLNRNIFDFLRLRGDYQYTVFDFFTVGDVFRLFYTYLSSGRISGLNYLPEKKMQTFCGRVYDSTQIDFFKFRSFQFFVELFVAKKILQKKKNLFYVFENQAYEQAWLDVAERENVRTFGFQSSGFSRRFFNFFPSTTFRSTRKSPSVILTASPRYSCILKEGFGNSKIVTVGTSRVTWNIETNWDFDLKTQSLKILVLLPVHFNLYKEVIEQFESQFYGCGTEVWYRPHPLHIKKMRRDFPAIKTRVQDSRKTDRHTFLNFRCCFSFDNSLAFDALLSGTITFELSGLTIYDDSRFLGFSIYDCRIPIAKVKEAFAASISFYTAAIIGGQVDYCASFYRRFNSTEFEKVLE